MAIVNWVELIENKLLSKGMTLKTDISILSKNKIFFNEILRDLLEEYPNKRFQHIILSMKDHYEIEEIYELLDDQNISYLKRHIIEEDSLTIKNPNKRKSRKS
jgi:hypothetical protein